MENRNRVRLLITDTDPQNYIFQTPEIDEFLAIEDDNVKRAAALALETIATNEVLVLKVIKLLDLTTDGASVSAELRERAKDLRAQAEDEEFSIYPVNEEETESDQGSE